ncbi:MAG: hypothetical protein ACYC9L_14540 [Sulfuricaulis sp.]
MPLQDERNTLRMGPPQYPGQAEITPAMVEAACQRIKDAGGSLTIWAVLHEDLYDSPVYADDEDDNDSDFGLSICGIALNSVDADRLAALDVPNPLSKWIVRGFRLGLVDDLPAIMNPFASLEGITINDVVEILSEIPPGATASQLLTGSGCRKDGPLLALP